ncbi:MAG: poly-gamma-glutamate biosynthesis protein PgsC [Negativicutes bacterium]
MHFLFIGILVSLFVTETTGFSPGGVVTAGYLALFALQPVWLAGTLAVALVTWGVVRLLGRWLLLYGRRLFAMHLLTGMLLGQALMLAGRGLTHWDWGISVIGWIIPGLLSRDFDRQGLGPTVAVTALAVVLIRLVALLGDGLLW